MGEPDLSTLSGRAIRIALQNAREHWLPDTSDDYEIIRARNQWLTDNGVIGYTSLKVRYPQIHRMWNDSDIFHFDSPGSAIMFALRWPSFPKSSSR